MSVLVWTAGPDADYLFFNRAWRDLLGQAGTETVRWQDFVHPDDLAVAQSAFRDAIKRRAPFRRQYRVRDAKGAWCAVEERVSPFLSPDGSFCGYVGHGFEMAEQSSGELRLLNERLEGANRELESFTYSVSHDLRAPLRSILGYANILLEDFADEIGDQGNAIIRRQADAARRMEKLISDLLNYTRLGRHELVRTEFDLSRLATEVSEEICDRAWGCDVKFDIEPGLRVYADPTLLRYVLQNLFENGVKYSVPTRNAHVKFGKNPEGAFFVQDQGIGFDMAYADKLFKPFERLHSASEFPGTGIGLANVQRAIHRHGGQVGAKGSPNEGATFWFTLP